MGAIYDDSDEERSVNAIYDDDSSNGDQDGNEEGAEDMEDVEKELAAALLEEQLHKVRALASQKMLLDQKKAESGQKAFVHKLGQLQRTHDELVEQLAAFDNFSLPCSKRLALQSKLSRVLQQLDEMRS